MRVEIIPVLGCGLAIFGLAMVTGCIPDSNPELAKIKSDLNYNQATPYFEGSPDLQILPPNVIDAHPGLTPLGQGSMHNDSYNSDTHSTAGPVGTALTVDSADMSILFGGQCGNTLITSDGTLLSFCPDISKVAIFAMVHDTVGFRKVAQELLLPNRESSETGDLSEIMSDTSGGVYFHLDSQDRIVLVDAENNFRIIALQTLSTPVNGYSRQFVEIANYDLDVGIPLVIEPGGTTRQADVTDVMPDWSNDGLYWFVTREGHVATVDTRHGAVTASDIHLVTLPGEEFLNSVAMDSNGVYAASDHAMYRFVRGSNDEPVQVWRETYNRGTMLKPGQVNQGTGTTPTLMGEYDDLVAVTDNADAAINLVVYKRTADVMGGGNPAICTIPLFNDPAQSKGDGTYKSATDNSPIGYRDSVVIGNTYGYTSPLSSDWVTPGLWRVDVIRNAGQQPVGCSVVWKNNTSRQTAVSKLSTGNGLVYTYSREPISIGAPHEISRAYYFGAVNFSNGELAFKVLTGTGGNFNDNYSPITIAPDGKAYIGVFAGIVSVQ